MIHQFDVFPNPVRATVATRPFLVSVQHKFFDHSDTRVLAPLIVQGAIQPLSRLNPAFEINTRCLYLLPTDLVTLSVRFLGDPVTNLESDRDRIIAALDMVFTGI